MARKRPGALRADRRYVCVVPGYNPMRAYRGSGLSNATCVAIMRWESREPLMDPGDVGRALAEYRRFLKRSGSFLYLRGAGCPCPGCHLEDPATARDYLERALCALPPRARRELRL